MNKEVVKEYLINNWDETQNLVNMINSWNGNLESLVVYSMDEIDEALEGWEISTILMRVHYGDFNPNNNWWGFDGLANLVSFTDWELQDYYKSNIDDIIEALDNVSYCDWLPASIKALLDSNKVTSE